MKVVKVGRRYVITIPSDVREKLGIREGSLLIVRVEDDKIVLEPLPNDPFRILEEVIGEPYDEDKDEKRAFEELMRYAGR